MSESGPIRLQKLIARSGIASRREAERLISSGLVAVNGELVTELGIRVLESDSVSVRGRVIKPAVVEYIGLNKPRGYVCSRNDERGFPSFLNLLPEELRSVHHIGRLDVASEGLLLATTDGSLTNIVTHPRFEVPKLYEVMVRGEYYHRVCDDFITGAVVDGELLRFQSCELLDHQERLTRLLVRLIGGKNREIRRLAAYLGFEVASLCRVAVGPIRLESLKRGMWRRLTGYEVDQLRAFDLSKNG